MKKIGILIGCLLLLNLGALPAQGIVSGEVKTEIISATLDNIAYHVGEVIRINILLKNSESVAVSDSSLVAFIERDDGASEPHKFILKKNIKLQGGEQKILTDIPLWRVPDNEDLAKNYSVNLELIDSETETRLDLKHNIGGFSILKKNVEKGLNDSELPSVTASHRPVFPTDLQEVTFNVRANDETKLSTVSIYLDNKKIKEWFADENSLAGEYTVNPLTPGLHVYRVEASDNYNVNSVQNSIITVEEGKPRPKWAQGALFTKPPISNAHFKLNGYDLYTDETGSMRLALPEGNYQLEIVDTVVSVSDLEQMVFAGFGRVQGSGWDKPVMSSTVNYEIVESRTHGIESTDTRLLKEAFVMFEPEYRTRITTDGLPEGAKVEISVNLPQYNERLVSKHTTPFTFTIPKWLKSNDAVKISMKPDTVTLLGKQYMFTEWREQNNVMAYTTDTKLSARALDLVGVYKEISSKNALMVNLVHPEERMQVSSPVELLAKVTLGDYPLKGAKILFYLDGQLVTASESDEYGEAFATIKSKIADGLHKWYVRAKLAHEQSYVDSPERSFLYMNKRIAEISQVITDRQSYSPGDMVRLNTTINYLDNEIQSELSLLATIYDSGKMPVLKSMIAPLIPAIHGEVKLDNQYLWQVPLTADLGDYYISLELLDKHNNRRNDYKFTDLRIGEQPKETGMIERYISLPALGTLTMDVAKSVDINGDTQKDAVVYVDIPYRLSELTINMSTESDDNMYIQLHGAGTGITSISASPPSTSDVPKTSDESDVVFICTADGCFAEEAGGSNAGTVEQSPKKQGIIGQQISVNGTEAGVYMLHVSGRHYGSSATVDLSFRIKQDMQVKVTSTTPDKQEYRNGDLAKILASINNSGSASTAEVIFQLSDENGNFVKQLRPNKVALEAHSTKDVTKHWRIPKNLPQGTYYLTSIAYIVPANKEYDITHNIAQFTVSELPRTGEIGKYESEMDIDSSLRVADGKVLLERYSKLDPYSIIYINRNQNPDTVLKLISSDELQEHNMKGIFYGSSLNYIFNPVNEGVQQNPCVSVFGEDVQTAICFNLTDTSALSGLISEIKNALQARKLGNLSIVLEGDDEGLAQQLSADGTVFTTSDKLVYDLFYDKAKVASGIKLPDQIAQLVQQARMGKMIYGVEDSGTVIEKSNLIADYLNGDDVSSRLVEHFGEIIAKVTTKYNLDDFQNAIGQSIDRTVYRDLYRWAEYHRAKQLLTDLTSSGALNNINDFIIKYAQDYLDRNTEIRSSVGLSDYDRVLTNVNVVIDESQYDLAMVYLNKEKVIAVIMVGIDLSRNWDAIKTSHDLRKQMDEMLESMTSSSANITMTHGLNLAQFDSLQSGNLLTMNTNNYSSRGFDLGMGLTSTDLRILYESVE